MKKSCELCSKAASMYCDSDQASLCWDCDERVHCANFLVAKHSRSLLCHVCQSPTPWKASGTRLTPTLSVCQRCFSSCSTNGPISTTRRRKDREDDEEGEDAGGEYGSEVEYHDEDQFSDSDRDFSDDNDSTEEEEEEEEKGENQVVPWSSSATPSSSALPPPATGSSEYGSFSTRDGGGAVTSAFKRPHLDSDEEDEDEDGCCSSRVNPKSTMEENGVSTTAMKMARSDAFSHQTEAESSAMGEGRETESKRFRSEQVLRSFSRFQQTMVNCGGQHSATQIIQGISKLSRHMNERPK